MHPRGTYLSVWLFINSHRGQSGGFNMCRMVVLVKSHTSSLPHSDSQTSFCAQSEVIGYFLELCVWLPYKIWLKQPYWSLSCFFLPCWCTCAKDVHFPQLSPLLFLVPLSKFTLLLIEHFCVFFKMLVFLFWFPAYVLSYVCFVVWCFRIKSRTDCDLWPYCALLHWDVPLQQCC